MKKVFLIFALIAFVALTGCQQAQQSSSSAVPASTAAAQIGASASNSVNLSSVIFSAVGIQSAATKGVLAKTATVTPVYASGWWSFTLSYGGGITLDASFRVWDSNSEITNTTALGNLTSANVKDLWVYATLTMGTASIKMGNSTTDPLKLTGLPGSKVLNGSISSNASYSGTSYSVIIAYSSLSIDTSGYPNGNINFSITSGGSTIYAGTIAFNGSSLATITFTSGSSAKYTCNLVSGAVTAASVK